MSRARRWWANIKWPNRLIRAPKIGGQGAETDLEIEWPKTSSFNFEENNWPTYPRSSKNPKKCE